MNKAMAGAIPHDPDLPLARYIASIEVRPGVMVNEGSCNACTNGHYTLDELNRPMVTVVSLRGLTFRLCAACLAKLKEQL